MELLCPEVSEVLKPRSLTAFQQNLIRSFFLHRQIIATGQNPIIGYIAPILHKRCTSLILVETNQYVQQIFQELRQFRDIPSEFIFPIKLQDNTAKIYISTLMQIPKSIDLMDVSCLILDQLNWSREIELIRQRLAADHQIAVINSTMTSFRQFEAAVRIQEEILYQPLFLDAQNKKKTLLNVLRRVPKPPVLIYCNTTDSVDTLVEYLHFEQFHVAGIHGKVSTEYRNKALRGFREGYVDVMIGTRIGIEDRVPQVIFYDMPHEISLFEKRSATAAKVTAFITKRCTIARELEEFLHTRGQPVPVELHLLNR